MKNLKFQSVFDIIGPVMVGPSSSHTAGAVRIGKIVKRSIQGGHYCLAENLNVKAKGEWGKMEYTKIIGATKTKY